MAAHSSIFAWKIPWTEEPGGLQSMGSQRVRHNGSQKEPTCAAMKTQSSPPKIINSGSLWFQLHALSAHGNLWFFWNAGTGFIRKELEEQKLPFPKPNLKEEDSRSRGAGQPTSRESWAE